MQKQTTDHFNLSFPENQMQAEYSGPSLMMASMHIRDGLQRTSPLIGFYPEDLDANGNPNCINNEDPKIRRKEKTTEARPREKDSGISIRLKTPHIGSALSDTIQGCFKLQRFRCQASLQSFQSKGILIKVVISITISVLLLVLIILIWWYFSRTKSSNPELVVPSTKAHTPTTTVTISPVRDLGIPRDICFNVSCLRTASIITERYGDIRGFIHHRIDCSQDQYTTLKLIIDKLSLADTRTSVQQVNNGISALKQRVLDSVFSSITETLQNIPIQPYEGRWFQKLSIVYQKMIARSAFSPAMHVEGNEAEMSQLEIDRNYLSSMLQLGNIAFHGLDNVLINVQLELRVPLFFTSWITRKTNIGLFETLTPHLATFEQTELRELDQLKLIMDRKWNNSRRGSWGELRAYIAALLHLIPGPKSASLPSPSQFVGSWNLTNASLGAIEVLSQIRSMQSNSVEPVQTTLRELMRRTQQALNFPRYMGVLMQNNRTQFASQDFPIWIHDAAYFDKLGDMLKRISLNDLQQYITFSILNKYAGFVYPNLAKLKQKLTAHLAEDLGLQYNEHWPALLELTSPGLKTLILQRWSLNYVEKATNLIRQAVIRPILSETKKLVNEINVQKSVKDTQLLEQLSKLSVNIIRPNIGYFMDHYYDTWYLDPDSSLLAQLVQFNTFMALKADPSDYRTNLNDPGLSSRGRTIVEYNPERNTLDLSILALQWPYFAVDLSVPSYMNFGPLWYSITRTIIKDLVIEVLADDNSSTLLESVFSSLNPDMSEHCLQNRLENYLNKEQLSSKPIRRQLAQILITFELVGRAYETLKANSPTQSQLRGINLPDDILYYLWIFQNICEATTQQSRDKVREGLLDECLAVQIAAQLSPAFRRMMNCPKLFV